MEPRTPSETMLLEATPVLRPPSTSAERIQSKTRSLTKSPTAKIRDLRNAYVYHLVTSWEIWDRSRSMDPGPKEYPEAGQALEILRSSWGPGAIKELCLDMRAHMRPPYRPLNVHSPATVLAIAEFIEDPKSWQLWLSEMRLTGTKLRRDLVKAVFSFCTNDGDDLELGNDPAFHDALQMVRCPMLLLGHPPRAEHHIPVQDIAVHRTQQLGGTWTLDPVYEVWRREPIDGKTRIERDFDVEKKYGATDSSSKLHDLDADGIARVSHLFESQQEDMSKLLFDSPRHAKACRQYRAAGHSWIINRAAAFWIATRSESYQAGIKWGEIEEFVIQCVPREQFNQSVNQVSRYMKTSFDDRSGQFIDSHTSQILRRYELSSGDWPMLISELEQEATTRYDTLEALHSKVYATNATILQRVREAEIKRTICGSLLWTGLEVHPDHEPKPGPSRHENAQHHGKVGKFALDPKDGAKIDWRHPFANLRRHKGNDATITSGEEKD